MINYTKTKFIKSAPSVDLKPQKNLPEVLFVGKSNVGKSSLINALCKNSSLAKTSSKPGFTKLLNYYEVDEKFYLVDAPGYGYTISGNKHLGNFGKMMEEYFDNSNLKLVVFLIDSRHEMSRDDADFYQFLTDNNIPYLLITTKIDKLNQKENARLEKYIESIKPTSHLKCSILKDSTIGLIKSNIAKKIFEK